MQNQKSLIYLSAAQAAFMVSGYVINIFLARFMGPVTYGMYGVVIALMTIINVIQISGIPQSLSYSIAKEKLAAKTLFLRSLPLQLILTLLLGIFLYVTAPLIASLLGSDEITVYIRYSALIFPTYGIYSLYTGYLNGLKNFKLQAYTAITYACLKALLIIMLAFHYGIFGALVGFALAPLLTVAIFLKKSDFENKSHEVKPLVIYAMPLIAFSLLNILTQTIDVLVAQFFDVSAVTIGNYIASQNIALLIYFSAFAVSQVAYPVIAKLHSSNNIIKLGKVVRSAITTTLIITLPLCAFLAGAAHSIVQIIYGSQYSEAATILEVLAISYLPLTFLNLLAQISNSLGMARSSVVAYMVALATLLFTSSVGAMFFGVLGIALAVGIAASIGIIFLYVTLRNKVIIKLDKRIAVIAAASVAIYIITRNISSSPILMYLIWATLTLVYGLILVKLDYVNLSRIILLFKKNDNKAIS